MCRSRSPTGLRAVGTKVSQATGQPNACFSLAASLIHPWGEPMGVCRRKSATITDWRILSSHRSTRRLPHQAGCVVAGRLRLEVECGTHPLKRVGPAPMSVPVAKVRIEETFLPIRLFSLAYWCENTTMTTGTGRQVVRRINWGESGYADLVSMARHDSDPHVRLVLVPIDSRMSIASPPERAEMPLIDLRSAAPLPEIGPAVGVSESDRASIERKFSDCAGASDRIGRFGIWLNGDVVLCTCPDCQAPMTIRLWLMIADCWRCDTSIELTEQQEREARRLLHQRAEARGSSALKARPASKPPASRSRVAAPPAADLQQAPRRSEPTKPVPPPVAAPARKDASKPFERRGARRRGSFLSNMPAWLISLLLHVLLLTILGLLTYQEETESPYITLSTRVTRRSVEGGDTRVVKFEDMSVFDLGIPDGVNMEDPAQRRVALRADQQARELRLVDTSNPHLPDIKDVRKQLSHSTSRRAFAARDPRLRVEIVKHEGGTTLTEAAVARGLRWVARHQNPDGSWSLDRFNRVESCNCGGRASLHSDMTGTALALLPLLGAGQTHLTGIYKNEVAQGLRWLVQHQKTDGDLRGSSAQYPGMYTHGQATIVLCEAFLMTGDERLRVPAQLALDFIIRAQYLDGGWRYYPRQKRNRLQGDTSVLGWQLMALQSGLAANLAVPEETLENAGHFLDTVQRRQGAQYGYMHRENPTAPMTAEGLLCRIYLGWKKNQPPLREGVDWLLKKYPPAANNPNVYYWYYATQVMHHYGGRPWLVWNLKMRDVLISTQETRGHQAGSWTPRGPLTSQGGRVYMTALAVCCLEVYYRHLPLFRQIDLQ